MLRQQVRQEDSSEVVTNGQCCAVKAWRSNIVEKDQAHQQLVRDVQLSERVVYRPHDLSISPSAIALVNSRSVDEVPRSCDGGVEAVKVGHLGICESNQHHPNLTGAEG
jgi:hypothetical protein